VIRGEEERLVLSQHEERLEADLRLGPVKAGDQLSIISEMLACETLRCAGGLLGHKVDAVRRIWKPAPFSGRIDVRK
jgi:hypothetical protein